MSPKSPAGDFARTKVVHQSPMLTGSTFMGAVQIGCQKDGYMLLYIAVPLVILVLKFVDYYFNKKSSKE